MAGNSIGQQLVLTTFGESHGTAVGGVLDGFPSKIDIDSGFIQSELDRRKPGRESYSSPRQESDTIEILSGIFEGRSTGAPIAFIIRNRDARPEDYTQLKDLYRPSHADFTWQQKFGIRDYRGGGRSSARETAVRVAAGAFAKLLLMRLDILVHARIDGIGPYTLQDHPDGLDDPQICSFLDQVRTEGDTVGGTVLTVVSGVPAGLGEPLYDKLSADLAKSMFSINAVRGFELGSGFASAAMKGSEHNDPFDVRDGKIVTSSNHSGGIQGGISNGMEIIFRVAFKPVSTLMKEQNTLNAKGERVTFSGKGRHDVCIVPRALPVVEAMAALTLADHLLRSGRFTG